MSKKSSLSGSSFNRTQKIHEVQAGAVGAHEAQAGIVAAEAAASAREVSAKHSSTTCAQSFAPTQKTSDPVTGPAALADSWSITLENDYGTWEESAFALQGRLADNPTTAAVILAGGEGARFGNPGGKQLYEIFGKPLLTWSAEAFDACPDVGLIVIVCPDERRDEYCKKAIDPYPFVTPIAFATSGEIRQESAMNGVDAVPLDYDYIAVHDGARPLVTPDIITHAINTIKGNLDADGVVVGHPSIDTLKVVDNQRIVGTPDREMFWIAQTPQIFRSDICRRAYSAAMFEGFVGTDDSSLIERLGGSVIMLAGPRDNIKVTVPEDAGPAAAALSVRLENRGN